MKKRGSTCATGLGARAKHGGFELPGGQGKEGSSGVTQKQVIVQRRHLPSGRASKVLSLPSGGHSEAPAPRLQKLTGHPSQTNRLLASHSREPVTWRQGDSKARGPDWLPLSRWLPSTRHSTQVIGLFSPGFSKLAPTCMETPTHPPTGRFLFREVPSPLWT